MIAELVLAELRMNWRSAGFRVMAVILALFSVVMLAGSRYGTPLILRAGPLVAEVVQVMLAGLMLTLAPLLICGAARRESRLGMDELILSKPPSSEAILWGKFLGAWGSLLLLIPITVLAVLVAQPLFFRGKLAVLPAVVAGVRVVLPALFIGGLSFALATFFRTPMVAGLVIALSIGMAAGQEYLVPALQYTLTPYHLAYGLLGLALVAAMAGGWERRRQPERRLPASWAAAAGLLVAAVGAGAVSARVWRGWTMKTDPALARLADWRSSKHAPLPAMPLRTISGGTLRLSRWQGMPLVLVFWSPESGSAVVEAAALERAWRQAAPSRVGFATVCLTDDPSAAWDLAREMGLLEPAIWNPVPRFEEAIGLAGAFNISSPPATARAALIQRDGTFAPSAQPLSQPPSRVRGRPPHREWEQRLVELGTTAFRQLAVGGS